VAAVTLHGLEAVYSNSTYFFNEVLSQLMHHPVCADRNVEEALTAGATAGIRA
jgi:hypothetical protein